MNAGFSSLSALKAQLLAPQLRTRDDWDLKIKALGLGVAAAFETFCNRKFARVAGDFAITTGGRASWILPRIPIEEITGLDVRDSVSSAWIDSLLTLDSYNPEAGTIYFSTPLDVSQIRVTYTGGYWWNTAEGDPASQVIGQDTRSATVAIANGATSLVVTFASALPAVPTSISPQMLTPSEASDGVAILGVRAGSVTVNGFIVDFAASIPTEGYKLSYNAVAPLSSPAVADAATKPVNAAEIPADIVEAWLLQCATIWRADDKNGVAVTKQAETSGGTMAISSIDLIPTVRQILGGYVRFNLT